MRYWEECIRGAFEDANISASAEQIQNVAGCVKGAHETYGEATGCNICDSTGFIPSEPGFVRVCRNCYGTNLEKT